jgi:hypothetical protein
MKLFLVGLAAFCLAGCSQQQNTDSNGALEARVATPKNKSTISSLVLARSWA